MLGFGDPSLASEGKKSLCLSLSPKQLSILILCRLVNDQMQKRAFLPLNMPYSVGISDSIGVVAKLFLLV